MKMEVTAGGIEHPAESTAPAAPEPEIVSLAQETSSAHEQSIISELESKLSLEITEKEQLLAAKEELLAEKEELARLLADREETIETMRMEGTMSGLEHPAESTVPAAPEPKTVSLAQETSSAHEKSIISELESKLSLEITEKEQLLAAKEELLAEKEELAKLLADREETIETMRMEGTMGGFEHPAAAVAQVSEIENGDLGFESHKEISNSLPVLRPVSSMLAGGLFAELAQASSSLEPVKPVIECKDQEAMTEPIESWIHTIPGLVLAPASTSASVSESEPAVGAATAGVAAATAAIAAVAVAAEKIEVEKNTIATNTETKSLVDGATSMEPKMLVDSAASTDSKSLADGATSTEDLPAPVVPTVESVSPKVMADDATSTEDLPVTVVPLIEKEAPQAKTLVDSTTSTDDLPALAVPAVEAITPQEPAQPTKTLVDSATSTDDLPIVAAIPQRNGHLANTTTGKTGEIAHAHLPEASTMAQDIAQVKVQDPTFAEDFGVSRKISKAHREINSHKLDATEPIPRTSQSDIPFDDERRHTCDMSQILVDTPSESAPPVPALPKNIARLQLHEDADNEGHEFRVSFGSAFGGPSGGLMTGRIEPVESSEQHFAGGNDEEAQQSEVPSPGRPATGPPSNLLARAARASMASILENGMPNDRPESVYNAHMSSISAVGGTGSYAYPPTSYPQRTTSIRTPSIKSEKMFSSSPPTHQSRNAGTTGAAVISGTTRMAYTFGNSSSQVHIPQQPTYQHITDSSGASIGRSKHRPSPSGSVSSLSTDYHHERRGSIGSSYDAPPTATDPTMIQIITQTMIGDYLWKYTRRPMASVISEKKHRRYFWVHPYTKTMYWSLTNPAADGSREQRAKSALIINVYQITEENSSAHSDLPNVSLLVQTTNRNLKLTAPTREKHELWYQSLAYLLSRPTTPGAEISTDNQTWSEIQASRGVTSDALLTIKNDKAVRKKASFGRLHTMFGRSKESSPASSPRPANAATGSGLNSTITASSFNYSSVGVNGPPTSGSGYPNHIINNPSQSGVGGYGTVNGGRIMPQQGTSSLGTSNSPKSGLTSGRGYEDEYYDGEDDEDEDDGELPEHVRQCCDGKHDIGSLHHDH
ncbi:hypothetical protein BGX21_003407 [Mortierella sp. AD011]|nr:hypothetical protein BGX21_003407 [Mortierella sp. AD011]